MSAAKNAYPNLRAEMSRRNVTVQDIAEAIGRGRDTVGKKLARERPLHYDEAVIIADAFFQDVDIRYLFCKPEKKE